MAKRKQKSKLVKIMKSEDDCIYETTQEDCQKWFGIINREIFNGALDPVDEIDIRWRRGTHAFYECHTDTENPEYRYTRLCMNRRYKSKKFFIEVMVHECIHHNQVLNNEPLGHGQTFLAWKDKLNRKGINLVKVYTEDEK